MRDYGKVTEGIQVSALRKIDVGTVAIWRGAGVSGAQLAKLVRAGELVQIRYGIYAKASLVTAAVTDPALAHALQVAGVTARTPGVASHHSAARMRGLALLTKPPDGMVTLTVAPGARVGSYRRAGVIRHAAELPDEHVTTAYGMRATAAARTVIDLARTAPFMDGVVVADSALYERHASKTELRRVLARCARWPGISRARQVADFADGRAESVLESCARVVFRDQGLPPPELQVHITGRDRTMIARVDFLWRKYGVVAEADGLLKYDSGERAIAERKRDRLLQEAGFDVIHFTWQELFADPGRVATRIREAFARAIRLAGS